MIHSLFAFRHVDKQNPLSSVRFIVKRRNFFFHQLSLRSSLSPTAFHPLGAFNLEEAKRGLRLRTWNSPSVTTFTSRWQGDPLLCFGGKKKKEKRKKKKEKKFSLVKRISLARCLSSKFIHAQRTLFP
jgi:hypothetical protein